MHKTKIDETKASIQSYTVKQDGYGESDVKDLLALGEEVITTTTQSKKKSKIRKARDDSDSEREDWEEVKGIIILNLMGFEVILTISIKVHFFCYTELSLYLANLCFSVTKLLYIYFRK